MEPLALLDGVEQPLADARMAVLDEGVTRGDGAFESVGIWSGRPFRLDQHLARLAGSLAALDLEPPDLPLLTAEAGHLLRGVGDEDGLLRIFLTASGTRLVYVAPQPVRPQTRVLVPQPAPWVRPLGTYGPAGAKSMSYAANMAATRAAQRAGGDDALLCSLEGDVLEGPTFAVMWVVGDALRMAPLELGIVDSVSRRAALEQAAEAGLRIEQGRFPLGSLTEASEVLICSAARDLVAVEQVGDVRLPASSPVGDLLHKALDAVRRQPGA